MISKASPVEALVMKGTVPVWVKGKVCEERPPDKGKLFEVKGTVGKNEEKKLPKADSDTWFLPVGTDSEIKLDRSARDGSGGLSA